MAEEKVEWSPPVGDWLAKNAGPQLVKLPDAEPEPRSEAASGDHTLAESSAARVQLMLEQRQRSLSRPSSRGLAAPPKASGSTAAVLSRPARPLLPRSFPQHTVWPVKAGNSDASKDLIASLQARLAHVEKLNQHQAAKITQLSQELNAEKAEKALLRRALAVAEAEADAAEDQETEQVQQLRSERDDYKEQVQAMTKFLRDYGLTWVGDDSVAQQLSRPAAVDVQVMSSRVAELNLLVEGARVQRTAVGGTVHARLVPDEMLPLTFFQDGVKLGHCPFQYYNSRAAEQLIQDIMDGYFPYDLKNDYPDGVMLKVVDRVGQSYAESAQDLQLPPGRVLNGRDKVVERRRAEKEVSLLQPERAEKEPLARLQVRMDQDHRAVFLLELWQKVGDLEDAVDRWCQEEGLANLNGCHLRTAFPPRTYADREQSMSEAQLAPSATLFLAR